MNPIIKATSNLIKAIRNSDTHTIECAMAALQKFADAWLVSGEGANLEGAGECCLADTDTTEAIKSALETWADIKED